MAAKLRKNNELTKKMLEKMKKLMYFSQIALYAAIAGSVNFYTVYSLLTAGWHSWHIAFIALSLLTILLVRMSVREMYNELKK